MSVPRDQDTPSIPAIPDPAPSQSTAFSSTAYAIAQDLIAQRILIEHAQSNENKYCYIRRLKDFHAVNGKRTAIVEVFMNCIFHTFLFLHLERICADPSWSKDFKTEDCLSAAGDLYYFLEQPFRSMVWLIYDHRMSVVEHPFYIDTRVILKRMKNDGFLDDWQVSEWLEYAPNELEITVYVTMRRRQVNPGGPSVFEATADMEAKWPGLNLISLTLPLEHEWQEVEGLRETQPNWNNAVAALKAGVTKLIDPDCRLFPILRCELAKRPMIFQRRYRKFRMHMNPGYLCSNTLKSMQSPYFPIHLSCFAMLTASILTGKDWVPDRDNLELRGVLKERNDKNTLERTPSLTEGESETQSL